MHHECDCWWGVARLAAAHRAQRRRRAVEARCTCEPHARAAAVLVYVVAVAAIAVLGDPVGGTCVGDVCLTWRRGLGMRGL